MNTREHINTHIAFSYKHEEILREVSQKQTNKYTQRPQQKRNKT